MSKKEILQISSSDISSEDFSTKIKWEFLHINTNGWPKVDECCYPSSIINSYFKQGNYVLSLYWGINTIVHHCTYIQKFPKKLSKVTKLILTLSCNLLLTCKAFGWSSSTLETEPLLLRRFRWLLLEWLWLLWLFSEILLTTNLTNFFSSPQAVQILRILASYDNGLSTSRHFSVKINLGDFRFSSAGGRKLARDLWSVNKGIRDWVCFYEA